MKTLFKTLGMFGLFFFLTNISWGQTTYNWIGSDLGSWTEPTNWASVPGDNPREISESTDILVFDGNLVSKNLTVQGLISETIGSIQVIGTIDLTFLSSDPESPIILTLTKATGTPAIYALYVANGSALNLIALEEDGAALSNAIQIVFNANANASINGGVTCSANSTSGSGASSSYSHKFTTNATNSLMLFGSGSSFSYGPSTTGAPFTGNTNTVQFQDGSTYLAFTGSNPSTTVQFSSASTYVHKNTAAAPTITNRTYGNFVFQGSNSTTQYAGGTLGGFTMYNLTVSYGCIFNIRNQGTNNIKGNITVDATATLNLMGGSANTATYNLNGTSEQNIIVSGDGVLNCKKYSTYSSTVNVNSGTTVNLGGSIIAGDGSFIVSNGSALKIGHPEGITTLASGAHGNIQTTTGRTYNANVYYIYNGSGGAQVTGNGLPSTIDNLTFSNAEGVTLTSGYNVNYAAKDSTGLLIFNGTTITGSSFTLSDGAKIKIDSPDGITSSGSTGHVQTTTRTFGTGADYEYTGSNSQYTGNGLPTTIRNLTISNTAGTLLSNNYTVTGIADVKSGAILICNAKYLDGITGTFDLNSGGTIKICSSNGITASSTAGNVRTAIRTYSTGGKYEFVGSTAQYTGDGLPSSVNSLTINNSNGVTLTNNVSVSNTCALTSGKITLGDKNLKILSGGSLTGTFGSSNMIVTNGTGELQKEITANSTLTYPIGDIAGNYTPSTLNFTSGTYGSGAYAGVKVTNSKLTENNSTVVFLNRYWEVNQSNISSFNCELNFQYLASDIAGSAPNESDLWGGRYSSGAWYILLKVNATDHQIVGTTTGFSKFTGGQESAMPVTLQSFTSNVSGRNVGLKWVTSTETNNAGFNIERKSTDGTWSKVGFVAGNGTKNTPTTYNFSDMKLNTGKYQYRLKQIDNNGNFEYYSLDGTVEVGVPKNYEISQNYPNPFNPTTKIDFSLPFDSKVFMVVYDMTGREVKTLVNEPRQAGYHTVELNASSMSSGTYFFRIIANANGKDFISTKKMVLVK